MSQKGLSDNERMLTLLFDEMKVKGGLVFSKSTGRLIGFTDLEKVNHDLDDLFSSLSGEKYALPNLLRTC